MANKKISDLPEVTELQPTDEIEIESGGNSYRADLSLLNLSVTKSADYTITDTDGYRLILVDDTSTDRTITLPTVADNSDRIITIINTSSDGGSVTVDGEGAETINGSTTLVLNYQYSSCTLMSDGTAWYILNACNVWRVDTLWTGSETTGTHSLDSGAFSDYDLLIFYVQNSTSWITSATISTTVFVAGVPAMIPGTSQYLYYDYVSDTSFSIPDRSTVVAVRIEGVKL